MVLTLPLALPPDIVPLLVPPTIESLSSSFITISGWKDYLRVLYFAASVFVLASFSETDLRYYSQEEKSRGDTDGKVDTNPAAGDAVLQGKSNS